MTLYDEELHSRLVAQLEENGIDFKVDGNVIWYTVADSESVSLLFDELMAERVNTFTFYEQAYAERFVEALKRSGITTQVSPQENGEFLVTVLPNQRQEANRIMAEVVFPNSEYRGVANAP